MASAADDDYDESSLKVFQNEYILEHLFSFLSVNDIKNCRLANRTWRKIGKIILRRRVHVLFDFRECWGFYRHPNHLAVFIDKENKMKEIVAYCKENTPEHTPLSSFTFQGGIEYFLLINFLDDVRSYMRELKIACPIHHKEYEKLTIDLSPKIPPCLTKLHIELHFITDVTLNLCFDEISFVKDIYLDRCTIVVGRKRTEKRLSPSDITLGPRNRYIKNGTNVEFLVNESFDLTLTKRINLNGKNLIIDFSDCANGQVERTVQMRNTTVRNWAMCNWKIKNFSLYEIPFFDKNFIEMEELTTENLQIDLSKIYNPSSLLKLCCCIDTTIADAPFFLPNLVDVTLMCENGVAKLPYFTNNKNISKMWLQSEEDDDVAMSISINDLPKGITKLFVTRLGVHGEGLYKLQTLYMLQCYPITKCLTFGAKFRPETFKIDYAYPYIKTNEEMQVVMQLLNLSDFYGRLVIGHFYWDETDVFNNSGISKYVDTEAVYYVFEGKRGRGLTVEEVEKKFQFCE